MPGFDLKKYEHFSDEALAIRALNFPETYEILVQRHRGQLLGFLRCYFPNSLADSEDLVQESFIRGFVSLKTFKPDRKFKTWLYRIAINCGYNFLRRNREILEILEVPDFDADPALSLDTRLEKDLILGAIAGLAPDLQAILELNLQSGLSPGQISKRLGLSPQAIKSRLSNAKNQLALVLGQKLRID